MLKNDKIKLAYASGGDVNNIDKNYLTLAKLFEKTINENGNERIYFYDIYGNVTVNTYLQIKKNALRVLKGLHKKGIKAHDMLIFQCAESKDFIDLFWACMYGGITPVLANLPKTLEDSTATDCLTVYNIWKMLDKANILVSDDVFSDYIIFSDKIGINQSCLLNISDMRNNKEESEIYETQPEDTAMMFFTSGSTGMPKGVVQTNRAAVTRGYGDCQLFNVKKDVLLNWMPLEHAGGVLMAHLRGVILGSTQILVDTGYILSNPLRWIDLIDKYRVNYSWAPHFAYVLINEAVEKYEGNWDLSCVRYLMDGGEMIHSKSGKQFLKAMKKYGMRSDVIYPAWGMCETCSGTLFNLGFDEDEESGVQLVAKDARNGVLANSMEDGNYITEIGVPIPGCKIKIVNYENELVMEDTIGRFLIRGEAVTNGYYKNEEVNKESYTEDGWFITGDLGFIHDGKMILTGREKDIIIVNGLNYNNVEIEAVIEENSNVEKSFSAVCSIIDPTTQNDILIAFVVPQERVDKKVLLSEVKRQVSNKLNLTLEYVIPVKKEDIPKTNLGKIQRAKLGKRFCNKEFDHLISDNKSVLEELDKLENNLCEKLRIHETALILDQKEQEFDYVPISYLSCKNYLYEEIHNKSDCYTEDSLEISMQTMEGICKIKVVINQDKVIVFYESGLLDFHFNVLVAKRIMEALEDQGVSKNIVYVPVSCLGISINNKDKLIKSYQSGIFDELIERMDISMKNDRVIPQWFYEEKLLEIPVSEMTKSAQSFSVVFCDDVFIMNRLQQHGVIQTDNSVVISSDKNMDTQMPDLNNFECIDLYDFNSYRTAIRNWCRNSEEIDIIHLFGCDKNQCTIENAQYKTVISIQNVIRGFEEENITWNSFVAATVDALAVGNENNKNYANSTLAGYCKAANDEGYDVKYVDIDSDSVDILPEIINMECADNSMKQIVYRNHVRNRIMLSNVDVCDIESKKNLIQNGFYAVTGGLGGIALKLSEVLICKYHASVLLLGRSSMPEPGTDKYAAYNKLIEMAENKDNIQYAACNITDEQELEAVIASGESRCGKRLNGIVHLAGTIVEKLISEQTDEDFVQMYNAKVYGTYSIGQYVKKHTDILLILTSSARTLLPGMTVSAYCSASEFNANISGYLKHQYKINVCCISWSQWDEIGMSKGLAVKKVLEEKGLSRISPLCGQNSFILALISGKEYLYVGLDQTKQYIHTFLKEEREEEKEIQIFASYKSILKKEKAFVEGVNEALNNSSFANLEHNIKILFDLPLDKNGRVDKNLLKNRKAVLLGEIQIVKPRNEMEQRVFACWEKVFQSVEFGITDNFFDLGGDSIKMIQLISALKSSFHIAIKNQEIFKLTTIEQQAVYVKEKYDPKEARNIVEAAAVQDESKEDEAEMLLENMVILSAAQKRQWIMYEMNPECPYYNNTIAIRVTGAVVIPCLKMAIYQLIDRHETLRTKYGVRNGTCYQIVEEQGNINIDEIDLMSMQEEERESKLEQLYQEEANAVIHIDYQIPIRATIMRCNQGELILLMSIHHIASDGWSMRVLLQDLSRIYSDILTYGRNRMPELNMQYSEYAKWQYDFMNSKEYQSQLDYWKEELKDAPPALELPSDRIREQNTENAGKRLFIEINEELTAKVKEICNSKDCTLYMFLMSAFASLMQRYSNQNDMILGTLIANRNQVNLENMIGFFVNTMPIRLTMDSDDSFLSLLNQVRNKTISMYDNQDVPFDALIDELGIVRESGKNPLFQVLFVVQNAQLESIKDSNAEWNLTILDSDTSKFDLIIQIFEIDNKLSIKFEYDINLFYENTIQRWGSHFKKLIQEIVTYPSNKIGNYEILEEAEKSAILSINQNHTEYESEGNIYQLFANVCSRVPNRTAVSYANDKITYHEMAEKVDKLALYLNMRGINKGNIVAIVAEKKIEVIVGLLAILKVGASYLPISPKYPHEFIENIFRNSKSKYILCGEDYDAVLNVEKIILNGHYDCDGKEIPAAIAAEDKAYVIYTSGSTGQPKGVVVSHRNVIRLVNNTNIIEYLNDDVILQTGSITFDASTFEIWGALLNGVKLHLVSEDILLDTAALKKEIQDSKTSIMWVSAPLFSQLVEADETLFNSVRVVMAGGDVVLPKYTNSVLANNPEIEIINGYGPTENTTFSTVFKVNRNFEHAIPIGKPISNSTAYVVNKNMQLQPIGVIGELMVGGDGVAKGYLNNPELTREYFVDDPFQENGTLYRTGDYARINIDGDIEFIGRIDNQVKIRGFRIELRAIEHAISGIAGVKQALARCITLGENNKKIVAYYVSLKELDIAVELENVLPEYMIPYYIIHIDTIPLNKNGKVDYKKLPEISASMMSDIKTNRKLPKTEEEKTVYSIWKKLLKTDDFGVNDNFFKLGGDSIMVIQLTNLIKQCGYDISTKMVFQYQTIRNLAMHLEKKEQSSYSDESVTGYSTLGPIQKWFFEQNHINPNSWNLPLMLHFNCLYEAANVRKAIELVTEYHDCLHSRFIKHNEEYVQVFDKQYPQVKVQIADISKYNDKDAYMKEQCEECQKKIQIEDGALLTAILFQDKDNQHLFIAVHHLAVDGISLRIIGEDILHIIKALEKKEKILLPKKTMSFMKWNELLKEYANDKKILKEYEYWHKIDGQIENEFEVTKIRNLECDSDTFCAIVKKSLAAKLLKEGKKKLSADANDLFLTALLLTFKKLFDKDKLAVRMEGHGRENIIENTDISRTVGWFTTAYPVILTSSHINQIEEAVIDIKEKLRQVPAKGIGYGLLKYMNQTKELKLLQNPITSFNYLGEFNEEMEVGSRQYGAFHDEKSSRDIYIDFNILSYQDNLKVYLTINKQLYKSPGFCDLLTTYVKMLEVLSEKCVDMKEPLYSASDFKLSGLFTAEVRKIVQKYHGNVTDIYPLSISQKGMLYHYMMDMDSEDYFGQTHCRINGDVNGELFEKAWNLVVSDNPILSTVYVWEEIQEPVQVVRNDYVGNIKIYKKKTPSLSDEEFLNQILKEDKKQKFDLAELPVARIILAEMEDHMEFIFSFPHIALDGWSVFIILGELLQQYISLKHNKTACFINNKGVYKDYIEWQYNLDLTQAQEYWKKYLDGFIAKNKIWGINDEAEPEDLFVQKTITLSSQERNVLENKAKECGVTVNTLLESALAVTISKFSGENDIVFGTTVSGRSSEIDNVNSIAGLMINTLPIRIQLNQDMSTNDYIWAVQEKLFEMKDYELYSMADIKANSTVDNNEELFDVLFVYENYPVNNLVVDSSNEISFERFGSHERTNYVLTIVAVPGDDFLLRFSYMKKRFDADILNAFISGIKNILLQLCEDNKSVCELTLHNKEYINYVIHEWSREAFVQTIYEDQKEIYEVINNENTDAEIYILDEDLELVSMGIPGEIYLGIASLQEIDSDWTDWMQNNRIENNLSLGRHRFLYKTGDYGMWISKGTIKLLDQ